MQKEDEQPCADEVAAATLAATTAATRAASANQHEAAGIRDAAILASAGQREADALRVEGQRAINLIWETTQRTVALAFTCGSLIVASTLAVFARWVGTPDLQLAAVVFLFGVANLVTGFYFGRTNHQKIGGVGPRDDGR